MKGGDERAEILLGAIRSRRAVVGVVGLGYVGLPLAAAFAAKGFPTVGVDLDPQRVRDLESGRSPIPDVSSETLGRLVREGNLRVASAYDPLAEADAISICVPTPLRKTREPDVSYILAAAEALAPKLRAGQLVVLESTTYPGTTREILAPRIEARGFVVGRDVFLGFSPERIDPGNPRWGIHNTPKIVSGATPTCAKLVGALYASIVEEVVPVSSPETAEVVKLLENTFRAVNIALVNEFAIVCNKLGLDVWEVVEAAATKPFGFLPFYPGPGIGGHCLPTDPHYLSWRMRALDYRVRFVELADEVNRAMPGVVVERVVEALNASGKAVRGSRLLLLGLAYKPGVGDVRESPAFDVLRGLRARGALVEVHDPFVPSPSMDGEAVAALPRLDAASLRGFDGAVVVTNHPGIDYALLVKSVPFVVDARNATKGLQGLGRLWKL
jgi:UDP-N-acetyl-D-glucosamine dehydrogenase